MRMTWKQFLFATLYLFAIQQEASLSSTCLYKWMRRAGIPVNKSKSYEEIFRRTSLTVALVKSLPDNMVTFTMREDSRSALALKNCTTGKSKQCVDYNPCQQGGVCTFSHLRQIHTCLCRKGLYGDHCKKDCNECVGEQPSYCKGLKDDCHDNATCVNTHGSFDCSCKKGFKGNGKSCVDDIECVRKPCSRHASCKDTFGSYTCSCFIGYQGNGKYCKPINECDSGPCQYHGMCRDLVNGYTCHCLAGYEGTHCEKRWLISDLHKPLPEALRNITKAMQHLSDEITGIGKTVKALAVNHCKPNPCKNGGTCIDQHNRPLCLCPVAFKGITCSETMGRTRPFAGKSCAHLFQMNLQQNGMYWIKPPGKAAIKVYCEMTAAGGGWMKVADINPQTDKSCPSSFKYISSPKHLCTNSNSNCRSTFFSTRGISFSQVRGFAYGYQYNSMDAFETSPSRYTINNAYVDGISITLGSPRKHIWTFAVGLSQDYNYPDYNCPCAQYPGPRAPSFVGNDYYCESGNTGSNYWGGWYLNQRLWDGKCYARSNCCNSPSMPFFVKSLGKSYTNRLEVRLCQNYGASDENVGVERLQLFVR